MTYYLLNFPHLNVIAMTKVFPAEPGGSISTGALVRFDDIEVESAGSPIANHVLGKNWIVERSSPNQPIPPLWGQPEGKTKLTMLILKPE